MERPWMKFHTRDWLDNKELRRCSPTSRAILIDLMCLAAEGTLHGYLCDKVGPLDQAFMAARCFVSQETFDASLDELIKCERLHKDDKGLFISRMVLDEEIRSSRAAGGYLSIGHPNTPKKGTLANQNNGTHVLKKTSCERACADSDSLVVLKHTTEAQGIFPKNWEQDEQFARFAADYMATGAALIGEDFAEAWQWAWKPLDFEQKLERIAALNKHAEEYRANPGFVPRPRKFLDSEWKRDLKPPRANGNQPIKKTPLPPVDESKIIPYDPVGDARRFRERQANETASVTP